jgi:quinohemoprotein amine dehydrogenase
MAINQMRLLHGVRVSSADAAVLVRYLADRNGLAPEETAHYRYILERQPNFVEQVPEQIPSEQAKVTCNACHSFARVALLRCNAAEWRRIVNFHLGQWPSTEYQNGLRTIEWWKIASTQIPELLGKDYPLKTAAWEEWLKHKDPDLSGKWRVAGHEPGTGDYRGVLTVTKKGGDQYAVRWDLKYDGGRAVKGDGSAILYTGYDWRGTVTLGGKAIQQVFAVAADGDSMTGRWFYSSADEHGGYLNATRVRSGTSQVMAVEPSSLRVGEKTRLVIVGTNLSGKVGLGDGVKVDKVVSSGPNEEVVIAQADEKAADGPRDVSVGAASGKVMLVVYHRLDSVRVEPGYGIARVGANGGPIAPVDAQFEAVGYLNGPDGKPGTKDDIRVDVMQAKWTVKPYDDAAAERHDTEFAGRIEQNGLFIPAGAGPNPKRAFSTNNTGDLKVVATVNNGGKPLSAVSHLIVTVQRWDSPPIL